MINCNKITFQKVKAQSIIEYSVLFVIVALAVGGMKMYLTRSVKAQFKVLQDQASGTYDRNDVITDARMVNSTN